MIVVDAHLDLAYNALRGRDVLLAADQQQPDADGIPSVGLPDLHAGQVGLICATIFCAPDSPRERGYRNADEAHAMALRQLQWYQQRAQEGHFRFIERSDQLSGLTPSPGTRGEGLGRDRPGEHRPNPLSTAAPEYRGSEAEHRATASSLPAIILLEGADPIRCPADVQLFLDNGVRIVGLAWHRTRYAGGTGEPGPLTAAGRQILPELDRLGIIHDASHLAEESFWQLMELAGGRVIASHSNCRSIVPTDRQLSDDMIRAIANRQGVVGINLYDRFLIPPDQQPRRATLADVVRHISHICDLLGNAHHVGLGTDMDGGLGRDQIPIQIRNAADLPRIADALSDAGFADAAIHGIMGFNWLRFFREALPG